jgi:hypothetical protein
MKELDRAAQNAEAGFVGEMAYFLKKSRKWWLLPFVLAIVVLGALTLLSSTAVAPFIYSIF